MATSDSKEFVDIEGDPRKIIDSDKEDNSSEDNTDLDDVEYRLINDPLEALIASQPKAQAPIHGLKLHSQEIQGKKLKGGKKTMKADRPVHSILKKPSVTIPEPIHRQPEVLLQRRGMKGKIEEVGLHGRLPGHPHTYAQSKAGGWVDESDADETDTDIFREVRKIKMDHSFQVFLVIGIIVVVLSVVGSVKLYEFFYGKPKIPENTFDWLEKDDKDEL